MRIHIFFCTLLLCHLISGKDVNHKILNREDLERTSRPQGSSITPRRVGGQIRFEDDPQYPDVDDLSNVSLDEQPSQPFRFQESPDDGRVTFQDDNRIEDLDNYGLEQGNREPIPVTFKDDNRTPDPNIKNRRRRRRRKPRYQHPGQYPGGVPPGQYPGAQDPYPGPNVPLGQGSPGYPVQLYPGQSQVFGPDGGQYPGAPRPIQGQYPGPNVPPGQGGYPHPYTGSGQAFGPDGRPIAPYYRPPRRRKQSFASEALSKVVGALSSIALYDDYQCVPRLLCEAAGGGALGTSSVLDSIAGLQPLLTLLAAYNGISSSPLFLFGRAVFLGMTAKGNTASCRYAYPQCPTDPEQLVHYLNNHNGGFFRFFNSPQPQIPQNVEQFYNQLSGQYGLQNLQNPGPQQYGLYDPQNPHQQGPQQNYGLYNPSLGPNPQNQNQQYGIYQPNPQNLNKPGPNYGIYQPNPNPYQGNYQNPQENQYGLYNQYHKNPNFYANQYNYESPQRPGSTYPNVGKYGFNNVQYKDKAGKSVKIEKRIQNRVE